MAETELRVSKSSLCMCAHDKMYTSDYVHGGGWAWLEGDGLWSENSESIPGSL